MSKEKLKGLIDHRTKGFCSIIKFSFDFCTDRGTSISKNDKLISTFKILPIFGVFTVRIHQIICHCEEIFGEGKLK